MAEEVEACASVHLPLDQLRLGVHSFCSSIVEWLGKGSVHGVTVEFESSRERVQVWQILGLGLVDPDGEALIVVGIGGEQASEVADEGGEPCYLGAGAGRGVDPLPLVLFKSLGRVSR